MRSLALLFLTACAVPTDPTARLVPRGAAIDSPVDATGTIVYKGDLDTPRTDCDIREVKHTLWVNGIPYVELVTVLVCP
jgi:hypothetical protein